MSDNRPIELKIVDDLEKSGFASEIKCSEILTAARWGAYGASAFYDRDGGITRNIDFEARRDWENSKVGKGGVRAEVVLPIEVKKASKPWIVFGTEVILGDVRMENPFVSHNLPCSMAQIKPAIALNSIRGEMRWIGHGVHEYEKKPNEHGRWFEAAAKLCKFSQDYVAQGKFTSENLEENLKGRSLFISVQPVVLLDAPLYRTLTKPKLSVEKVKYAPLNFYFGTSHYDRQNYRIDLVTLDGLEDYLKIMGQRGENIFAALFDGKRIKDNDKNF